MPALIGVFLLLTSVFLDKNYYIIVDQVWGQSSWILSTIFFLVFMGRNKVEVRKGKKKVCLFAEALKHA